MRAPLSNRASTASPRSTEADEAMAEMDALLGQARGDDRLQVGAVHGQMRRAVKLARRAG